MVELDVENDWKIVEVEVVLIGIWNADVHHRIKFIRAHRTIIQIAVD